ncbi:hypothetical protein DY000_02023190 [Brassica cretica]|uniref:Uncharacterized protein n=1 Tax=Brassica cretica TaxID=69181 RepID=A0ABQ7E482_BRACR|nr:hypothetical protein DY000_02023190 [Brassica cretica]
MESMIEKVLKIQQKTSAYLNLRLDVLYKELNGKIENLDAHVMMLDAQVSQTAEAVKKQEALGKGKAVKRTTSIDNNTMQSIDSNMGTSIDNNRRSAIDNRQYHTKYAYQILMHTA